MEIQFLGRMAAHIVATAFVVFAALGLIGCTEEVPHWHITPKAILDERGETVIDLSALRFGYSGPDHLENNYKEMIITVDRHTTMDELNMAYAYLCLNGYICHLQLTNGQIVDCGAASWESLEAILLPSLVGTAEWLNVTYYVVLGNCRKSLSERLARCDAANEAEEEEMNKYIISLKENDTTCEPIPNINSNVTWNVIEIKPEKYDTYEKIEPYIIQAAALGYKVSCVSPIL